MRRFKFAGTTANGLTFVFSLVDAPITYIHKWVFDIRGCAYDTTKFEVKPVKRHVATMSVLYADDRRFDILMDAQMMKDLTESYQDPVKEKHFFHYRGFSTSTPFIWEITSRYKKYQNLKGMV